MLIPYRVASRVISMALSRMGWIIVYSRNRIMIDGRLSRIRDLMAMWVKQGSWLLLLLLLRLLRLLGPEFLSAHLVRNWDRILGWRYTRMQFIAIPMCFLRGRPSIYLLVIQLMVQRDRPGKIARITEINIRRYNLITLI